MRGVVSLVATLEAYVHHKGDARKNAGVYHIGQVHDVYGLGHFAQRMRMRKIKVIKFSVTPPPPFLLLLVSLLKTLK